MPRARVEFGALLVRVGRRVAELRVARGWTQEQFAERARLDPRDFQKIEAGGLPLTLRRLLRLANTLEVDPQELLRDSATATAGGDAPRRTRR